MKLGSLINKGLLIVYGPLVLFVIASGFVSNWYATNFLQSNIASFFTVVILLISIIIGWPWWSYRIVKWKYWAFSQVGIEDGYELYRKAVEVGLIWPTGSFFNKTEIWTDQDKENWMKLKPEIRELFEV